MPRNIREQIAEQMTALDDETKVQSYLDLPDTPENYTDDALKLLRVNAGEDAVEFITDNKFDKVVDDSDDISEGLVNLLMTVSERAAISTNTSNISTNTSDISALEIFDARTDNPHAVTQTQVGLSNLDNVQQIDKSWLKTTIADSDLEVPTSGAVVDFVSDLGGGDMIRVTYDPTNVSGNAFAMDNMVEGTTTKILTAIERTKLTGIEALAEVTDAAKVLAAGAVMLTGAQTISAVKTFSAHPTQDAYAAPTTDAQFAPKKYVDDNDNLKMTITTYDPGTVGGNAFAMDNMVEGTTTKILTDTERTKLTEIPEFIGEFTAAGTTLSIALGKTYKSLSGYLSYLNDNTGTPYMRIGYGPTSWYTVNWECRTAASSLSSTSGNTTDISLSASGNQIGQMGEFHVNVFSGNDGRVSTHMAGHYNPQISASAGTFYGNQLGGGMSHLYFYTRGENIRVRLYGVPL